MKWLEVAVGRWRGRLIDDVMNCKVDLLAYVRLQCAAAGRFEEY